MVVANITAIDYDSITDLNTTKVIIILQIKVQTMKMLLIYLYQHYY